MGTIYLVRHGEATANVAGNVFCGWLDAPLTQKGVEQAQQLAKRFCNEPIDAIYSSDLERARITAEVIAKEHNLTVITEPELRELNYGAWEGLSRDEIFQRSPEWMRMLHLRKDDAMQFHAPDGESFNDFQKRVISAFDRIAMRHLSDTIIVVGHKMTNRVIICYAIGVSPALWFTIGQDEACVNRIETKDNGQYIVLYANDTCHMGQV